MDSAPRVRHQCASRAITPPFLAPAAAGAYEAVKLLSSPGAHDRNDIADNALAKKSAWTASW